MKKFGKLNTKKKEIQIDMAGKDLYACDCGSIHFDQTFTIRILLATDKDNPTGKVQYPVFPVYLCRECKEPFKAK